MDAVVEYVGENRDYVVSFIRERMPKISCEPQEGTYLMWLDFSALGMKQEDIISMLINEAHVAINDGRFFGEEGDQHFRLNLATPRINLVRVMENIENTIRGR